MLYRSDNFWCRQLMNFLIKKLTIALNFYPNRPLNRPFTLKTKPHLLPKARLCLTSETWKLSSVVPGTGVEPVRFPTGV